MLHYIGSIAIAIVVVCAWVSFYGFARIRTRRVFICVVDIRFCILTLIVVGELVYIESVKFKFFPAQVLPFMA